MVPYPRGTRGVTEPLACGIPMQALWFHNYSPLDLMVVHAIIGSAGLLPSTSRSSVLTSAALFGQDPMH